MQVFSYQCLPGIRNGSVSDSHCQVRDDGELPGSAWGHGAQAPHNVVSCCCHACHLRDCIQMGRRQHPRRQTQNLTSEACAVQLCMEQGGAVSRSATDG